MAGRLKAFVQELEQIRQETDALADRMEAMGRKYSRLRSGLWGQRAENAWSGLDQARENLELLTLMARDLVKGQENGEGCTEAPKVAETASKGDP